MTAPSVTPKPRAARQFQPSKPPKPKSHAGAARKRKSAAARKKNAEGASRKKTIAAAEAKKILGALPAARAAAAPAGAVPAGVGVPRVGKKSFRRRRSVVVRRGASRGAGT